MHPICIQARQLKKGQVNTQALLARKLGMSKVRLTQILNLLKLAPEIQGDLKNLNEPLLHRFFNEIRLRPIAIIKDEHTQPEKFEELKRNLSKA